MADVTIVCPTHGRAGEVTAFKTFGPDLLLCVAESQLPFYREAYPDGRFDVHPDSVKGLIAKVKWMHAKYGGYFRVDDDASPMIDHSSGELEGGKCGFLPGHQIWWPDDLEPFIDDIWACGLNAFYHRKCLIDLRYAIPTTVGQKGGLAASRTTHRVWEAAARLRDAFGETIALQDRATFDDTYPWNLRVPW
jgi:hypothetical protein